MYSDGAGSWTTITGVTTWDNLYYDDGSGTYAYPAIGDIAANSRMQAIISAGAIEYGTDPTYPPFEEKLTDGTYEGFDVDMMDEIAARLSTEYAVTIDAVIVDSDWDPIIPNLQAGEFDVILSAMTKTAERALEIDFTRAYYGSIQAVLGPTDGEVDIGGLPFAGFTFFLGFVAIGLIVRKKRAF